MAKTRAAAKDDGKRRVILDKEVPPPPPRHEGSAVWSAKFTEDDIRMLRKMYESGWTISALMKRFGTTWQTMAKIVKRQSWQHVKD